VQTRGTTQIPEATTSNSHWASAREWSRSPHSAALLSA